jgi:hypothetical protein
MSKTKAVTAETPGTVVRIANRRERSGSVWIGPRIADLAFDLFEALGVLALQQRRGQSISAVLGGGAVFHQGLAGEMKRLELEQGSLRGGRGPQLQQRSHACQHYRAQTVFASVPTASAKRRA